MNARELLRATLLVSLFALPVPTFAQAGPLDGKAFIADAGEKGKAADEKGDVITFQGGKFHSSACDQWGYGKGDYRASASGNTVTFETETASEKDGRLVWKGTIRGDMIEGTFVHHKKGWLLNPNPEPIEHWFKGKARS